MAGTHWRAIEDHELQRLGALFESEPDRLTRLARDAAGTQILATVSADHLGVLAVDRPTED